MFALVIVVAAMLSTISATDHVPFERAIEVCGRDLQVCETRLSSYRSLLFPDDHDTHCFVKCILVELRAWTNPRGTIKHSVIQQYFKPDVVDYDYEQRTRRCLEQTLPTYDSNPCSQAYWSFVCYKNNYGNFDIHANQFVPPTELQISQNLLDCVDVLNIPRDSLIVAKQNASASCFSRCFLHRSSIYDDAAGLDFERLYVLVGFDAEKEPFVENARAQLADLTGLEQCSDACQAAVIPERFYKEQLVKIFKTDGTRDASFVFDLNNL